MSNKRGFSLDFLSSAVEDSAKRRKAALEGMDAEALVGPQLVAQLTNLVTAKLPAAGPQQEETLELELRVGRVDGVSFRPGLQKTEFDMCLRRLRDQASRQVFVQESTLTWDLVYDPPDPPVDEYGNQQPQQGLATRYTIDARTGKLVAVLQKHQYAKQHVHTGLCFDLRLSLNGERQLPLVDAPPPNPSLRREKERWTFRRPSAPPGVSVPVDTGLWQMDVSKVTTTTVTGDVGSDLYAAAAGGSDSVVSYELELEFLEPALAPRVLPAAIGEALQFLEQLSAMITGTDPTASQSVYGGAPVSTQNGGGAGGDEGSAAGPGAGAGGAEAAAARAKEASERANAAQNDPNITQADRDALMAAAAAAHAAAVTAAAQEASGGIGDVRVSLSRDQFKRVGNLDELEALRQTCVDWVPGWTSTENFPGPLPAAFSRRHIGVIQHADYMVSEKSDGLRFLLYVQQDGAYLVDRAFDFLFVEGGDALADLYAQNDVTVLDGELVRHEPTGRTQFMVFDVIVVDGVPFAEEPLPARLKAIGERVVAPWRQHKQTNPAQADRVPFELIGKMFFRKKDLSLLFDKHIIKVRADGGSGAGDAAAAADAADGDDDVVRIFKDAKRHHRTDGIIFTPTAAPYYTPSTAPVPLLKWKYPPLITADFRMIWNPRSSKWVFRCTADGGEVECFDVDLRQRCLERLQADKEAIVDPQQKNQPIVELAYDIWYGIWQYRGLRLDKHVPNNLRTVFDTLSVVAENVTEHELKYRCSLAPGHPDNWRSDYERSLKRISNTSSSKE